MDRNLKLSVIDSLRMAKLQAMQERLQSLQILEEMAEMKTTEKVQMLKLQGKPAHVQAVLKLQQEVSKRSAAVKLSRLSASLGELGVRKGGAESV